LDRSIDWLKQAERDLETARSNYINGFYEWTCFITQQAAEKAVKALCEQHKTITKTHQLIKLLKAISDLEAVPEDIYEKGAHLDRFYVLTRYPNGFDSGAPMEYFFKKDAQEAISYAEDIIRFCSHKITR
jgi:HEPN domain-containing protein